jgi:hypothetical protein
MRKHLAGFVIAIATLSVGVSVGKLFRQRPTQFGNNMLVFRVSDAAAKFPLYSGPWKKVQRGRVSFSIPAYLKERGSPGGVGIVAAFGGALFDRDNTIQSPFVDYCYGQAIDSDFNEPLGTPEVRSIDGRSAAYYFHQGTFKTFKDTSVMVLVVPDVGDGQTKFQLYVSGYDHELMRQIIDSVEIRSSKPN